MNANDIISAEEMEAGNFWESKVEEEIEVEVWCWSCFRLHKATESCNRSEKEKQRK